jgi:hypothetical protein
MRDLMDLYAYVAHVTRLVLDRTKPEEHQPVPVCILGAYDTEWKIMAANREIYDESVMCPKGVERRIRDAREFQCGCGAFHGVVPKWVRKTISGAPPRS